MYYNYQQNQRQSFPELVGQEPYSAANFIASHGLTPVLMTPFDPMTRDYRMDRVRVIVCPRRNVVMQVPVVG